jgi:hypothetical protein
MKKTALLSLACAAGWALLGSSAFGQIVYSFNDYAGTSDDSKVNGGPTTTQAWTIATTTDQPSDFGSYEGSVDGQTMWGIYDAPGRYGGNQSGEITQTNNFIDGALQTGQSVSLEYATNNSVGGGGSVGLNLLSGSATAVSVYFLGGVGGFYYSDSTTTGGNTGQGFNPNSIMDFSFEVTGTDTYSVDFNGNTWDGTFSAPITGIQVFNENGGGNSDQYTNDLSEPIPEPSTYGLMLGGLALFGILLRRRAALLS